MRKHLLALSLPFFLFLISFHAFAQVKISGIVLSGDDKAPLPGVNVVVKGTTIGTATDVNGAYTLDLADANGVILTFSYIGFVPQSIPAPAVGGVVNVTLEADVKLQNESVVIGYGSVTKKDLTGSVVSVGSKDFQKGVITTPEALIAGKVAGVQITSNGGSPGSGSTIRIRGGSSLAASNDPLIVIDGVPVDNGGIKGSPSALGLINPNDIENMTVLKDASATAIYGSRAANGVIIITTKRGAITGSNRPKFSFSSQNSISLIQKYASALTGDQYRQLVQDSGKSVTKKLINYRPAKPIDDRYDSASKAIGDTNYSTNWQKEIFQPAYTTDNNVSMTGALKNIPYRISIGMLQQEGILKTDKMQRISSAISLNPSFMNGDLRVNVNFKSSISKHNFADGGAIGAAIRFDPTKPVYNNDSTLIGRYGNFYEWQSNGGVPNSLSTRNPVGLLNQRSNKSDVMRSLGNIQFDYALPFLKGLRANLNIGYDYSVGKQKTIIEDSAASNYVQGLIRDTIDGVALPIRRGGIGGIYNQERQQKMNSLVEFYLNYTKNLPSIDSKIEILAGRSFQDFYTYVPIYRERTYSQDTIKGNSPKFAFDKPQNRLSSYYGRINYTLSSKYLLTGTLRYDGSSKFSSNTRWGLFPSGAFAWKMGEETFIKNIKVISDLKLRIGYGVTGQQDINNNYAYQPVYSLSSDNARYLLGNTYYNMSRPNAYDANIRWETTATTNMAVDYGFFNDRIYGSIDVYRKNTTNLLNTVPTPGGANFSDIVTTNVGNLTIKGVEFSINTAPIVKENIRWDVGFNLTYNVAKITKLTSSNDPNYIGVESGGVDGGGLTGTSQINSVGFAPRSFFLYKQLYDVNGRPIEGRYADLNNDGVISDKDRYRTQQAAPKFLMGATSSLTIGQLTATAVVRGSFGNYVLNNVESFRATTNSAFGPVDYLNNINELYYDERFSGRLKAPINNDRLVLSDHFLERASFVRVDNLNVAYDLSKLIKSSNYGISLNIGIQNVFTFTKYRGLDPELFDGIDRNIYPRARVFLGGINFNF